MAVIIIVIECWLKAGTWQLGKVEMAEPLGGDQGFRVDQDGQGTDQGEDGQEGGGDQGDRALHQMAVGGETRFKGDGSEESEDKG